APRSRKRRSSDAVSSVRSKVVPPSAPSNAKTLPASAAASAASRMQRGSLKALVRVGARDHVVELGLGPDARRHGIAPGLDPRAPARRDVDAAMGRLAGQAHRAVEHADLGARLLG